MTSCLICVCSLSRTVRLEQLIRACREIAREGEQAASKDGQEERLKPLPLPPSNNTSHQHLLYSVKMVVKYDIMGRKIGSHYVRFFAISFCPSTTRFRGHSALR